MKNLDLLKQQKTETMNKLNQAIKDGNNEAFAQAFNEFAESLQEAIISDAQELFQTHDSGILAQRGIRQLTSEEKTYYQKVIDCMKEKAANPKQAVTMIDDVLPKTIIDAIFEDITAEHPLLETINFQNTASLIDILVSTTSGVAGWGELASTIDDELAGTFAVIKLAEKKLSAFIPVANAMLELGPVWLDKYVRTLLSEALATELEAAIVNGDGKGKPIGMTRKLTGAVDGVYPLKNAITVTKLDPETFGGILNTISQGPNNKRRAVPRLLMVVNPADYFTKVFSATTPRTTNGQYAHDALPYPTDIIVSAAAPTGKAIFGLAKRYFFGLGTAKGGKLEYSDEYKFLEDQRIYRIKLYGDGRALDENAFVLADISGLVPTVQKVEVTNIDEFPTV